MHGGLRVVDPNLAAESLTPGDSALTDQEADVLTAARDGGTVADIAGARTRAEAVRVAVDHGWLLPS